VSKTAETTRNDFGFASRDAPVFFPETENTYSGIISTPISDSMSTTGVILLAGTGSGTGTIGRNRMWVRMARTLADSGILTLRFDYAGVGDSTGDMVGYNLDAPAVEAIRAAFDLLTSRGVEEILLVGTCYGARTALAGSVGDPRITGIHLLAPPVRSNTKGSGGADHLAEHSGSAAIMRKAVTPRTIKRLLMNRGTRIAAARVISIKMGGSKGASARSESQSMERAQGASRGFLSPLRRLLADGVPVHFLFGTDDFYWTEFNLAAEGRLGDDLDTFKDLVDIRTVPGILRGFPSVRVQNLAIESVVDWAQSHVSGRPRRRNTVDEMSIRISQPRDTTEEITYFAETPKMFGVTHVPTGKPRASIVICSSTHAELLKSYRLEVLLARALAERGFAVHRFHYQNEGHSETGDEDLTLPAMIEAGREATRQISDLAGTDNLVYVGVRLGAYPATVLATEAGGTPLILWDPVLDTDRFMKEALRTHAIAAIKGEAKPETIAESLERLDSEGSIEVLGYEMTSAFHSSIKGRKLSDYTPNGSNVLVVPFGKLNQDPLDSAWGTSGIPIARIAPADRAAWWLVENVSLERQQRGESLAARTADWVSSAIS
jgi:pimeloyl-ACP methyl ester carboxylesterase